VCCPDHPFGNGHHNEPCWQGLVVITDATRHAFHATHLYNIIGSKYVRRIGPLSVAADFLETGKNHCRGVPDSLKSGHDALDRNHGRVLDRRQARMLRKRSTGPATTAGVASLKMPLHVSVKAVQLCPSPNENPSWDLVPTSLQLGIRLLDVGAPHIGFIC